MAEAPDASTEARWIAAAGRGDRGAFESLVRAHQGYLRQFLRRLCRDDTALADDLAQEGFIAAWRALPGFRGEARFRTWLTRLALNAYLQQRRRPTAATVDTEADAPVSDFAPDAARRLDLARALAQLREPEREALLMCFYADLSHAEAAEQLGWPLGTLKTQVLRARARLKELLADWECA
jgi:RNA polymerase sigma-70 factor (ECF subfamily)